MNSNNINIKYNENIINTFNKDANDLAVKLHGLLSLTNENIHMNIYGDKSNSEFKNIIKYLESVINQFVDEICDFYVSNPEYIVFVVRDSSILSDINDLIVYLSDLEVPLDLEYLNNVKEMMDNIFFNYVTVKRICEREGKTKELIDDLHIQVLKAKENVKHLESAKLALEGQKTETIYSEASQTYLTAARNYEVIFYMLIGAAVIITVICLAYFPYSEATKVNFIFSKILTATLVITLGTLFLRKAAHLRKLHEQAHQTSLELQALPLYLVNVSTDHQAEIYKDLASKYFGKELDKTQHDKIGDLMTEQVKTSLEVFKTSSEIMKSMKPSVASSESSEAKEKPKNE
ncbi:hypothetical protein [Acinetobacter junii]|uniref:hypothetical protein n=1 Tax=Acinetobacter junii TaxID=40215 RepID=UPI0032155526